MEINCAQYSLTLPFVYPKWMQIVLERSKTFGLVIRNGFQLRGSPVVRTAVLHRIKAVIIEHTDRIREIEICGIESSQLEGLLDGIPNSSLSLASLVLTTYRGPKTMRFQSVYSRPAVFAVAV